MPTTITAKIASKIRKISNDRILTATVIVEFGVGIRLEMQTTSRITKANGFDIDTECAYRPHPITDIKRVIKEEKTDVFTHALVQDYVDHLNAGFDRIIVEVEDHFQTIDQL